MGIFWLKVALLFLVYIASVVPMILALIIGSQFLEETAMGVLTFFLFIVSAVAGGVLVLGIGIRLFLSDLICIDTGTAVVDSLKTSWAVSKPIAAKLLALGLLYGGAVALCHLMFLLPGILSDGLPSSADLQGASVAIGWGRVLAWFVMLFLGRPYLLGLIGATYELATSTHKTHLGGGVH